MTKKRRDAVTVALRVSNSRPDETYQKGEKNPKWTDGSNLDNG